MTGVQQVQSLCIFGAPLGTGNLGLTALGLSVLDELTRRLPNVELNLFDNEQGVRRKALAVGARNVKVVQRGAQISRRVWRGESLWTMSAASRFAPFANANVRASDACRAVLDISGGDSFADIYGQKQLNLVTLPKVIALQRGVPLLLLPQTYGPFTNPRSAQLATRIVGSARQAWARDRDSFDRLCELAGDAFDPARHRCGVDVAFALRACDPGERVGDLRSWLGSGDPIVGINVSGLLYLRSAESRERFGLADEYPDVVYQLVRRLLDESGVRVLLVPHVLGLGDESDDRACAMLASRVDDQRRVAVLAPGLRADETKHVIGRLDWFIGARMHATIAALSSRTPVAGIAYSDKFRGVFAECGVPDRVLDARHLRATDLVDAALAAWKARDQDEATIRLRVPGVEDTLRSQFDDLVEVVTSEGRHVAS
jgi:colanic acid/amylovoran biosynthesis protein